MAVFLGWAVAAAAVGAFVSLFSGKNTFTNAWPALAHQCRERRSSRPAAAAGNVNFAPGACERLEPYLSSKLVGQELALRQITDAICDHLAKDEPQRPLVLSLHGPPGVGKSMFHRLAAQALYNRRIHDALRCPGLDCAGYKVCEQRRRQLLQCCIVAEQQICCTTPSTSKHFLSSCNQHLRLSLPCLPERYRCCTVWTTQPRSGTTSTPCCAPQFWNTCERRQSLVSGVQCWYHILRYILQ